MLKLLASNISIRLLTHLAESLVHYLGLLKKSAHSEGTLPACRTKLRACFKFCRAYNLLALPVTEQVYWLYLAFLVGSFSSYNSVINYLTCLKQVNPYLGAGFKFFAPPVVNYLKQASKRVLARSPARKLPIRDILLAIFKCFDFRLPLHVSMWAVFLVAFVSLLRKSNLVPTAVADVASNSATHLRMCDVSFHQDHCILHVYKTKTIQFRQRALQIVLPVIPHSILFPVSVLKHHLANFTQNSQAPLFTIHTPAGFKPVTGLHFTKFIKSCIVNIGLDPAQYSPHSFRRGGATFAFNAGTSPLCIAFWGIGPLMPTWFT